MALNKDSDVGALYKREAKIVYKITCKKCSGKGETYNLCSLINGNMYAMNQAGLISNHFLNTQIINTKICPMKKIKGYYPRINFLSKIIQFELEKDRFKNSLENKI